MHSEETQFDPLKEPSTLICPHPRPYLRLGNLGMTTIGCHRPRPREGMDVLTLLVQGWSQKRNG
jgi:hypothetical protein